MKVIRLAKIIEESIKINYTFKNADNREISKENAFTVKETLESIKRKGILQIEGNLTEVIKLSIKHKDSDHFFHSNYRSSSSLRQKGKPKDNQRKRESYDVNMKKRISSISPFALELQPKADSYSMHPFDSSLKNIKEESNDDISEEIMNSQEL
jgi:hypothetical protein